MMSGVPACPTCGASLEDNIGLYITMWVESLVRRNHKSDRGDLVNPVSTNFTVLAEHLLSPLGKHNGLERPDHRAQGGI